MADIAQIRELGALASRVQEALAAVRNSLTVEEGHAIGILYRADDAAKELSATARDLHWRFDPAQLTMESLAHESAREALTRESHE